MRGRVWLRLPQMARDIADLRDEEFEEEEEADEGFLSKGFTWVQNAAASTKSAAWSVAKFGGSASWVIATTMVITLLPLVIEIEREQGMEQLQKLQMEQLKQQGYTDQQLAQMGLMPEAPSASEAGAMALPDAEGVPAPQ